MQVGRCVVLHAGHGQAVDMVAGHVLAPPLQLMHEQACRVALQAGMSLGAYSVGFASPQTMLV